MNYSIRQPLGYSQIGKKDQQEDAVFPFFKDVNPQERVFVLCDGVGGSEHGEVASTTTSKIIQTYLADVLRQKGIISNEDVDVAVERAYDKLDEIDTKDGDCSMATTLTCIAMHKDGVLTVHMGDSRIYQVRPSKGIMFQTSDHSLVNALLQAGELTPEEAETFPRKNVITRAIQPNTLRMKAEVHLLTDVQDGDYFFLCCDGVLERLTNQRLVEILSMKISDNQKIKLLEAESTDRTKDNYTAYLIPIDRVEGMSSQINENEMVVTTIDDDSSLTKQAPCAQPSCRQSYSTLRNKNVPHNNKLLRFVAVIFLIVLLVFGINSLFFSSPDNNVPASSSQHEDTKFQKQPNSATTPQEKVAKENNNSHNKFDTIKQMSREPVKVPLNTHKGTSTVNENKASHPQKLVIKK